MPRPIANRGKQARGARLPESKPQAGRHRPSLGAAGFSIEI